MSIKPNKGMVLWFTGLSGAGKSTLTDALCEALEGQGMPFEHLDGDAIRKFFPNTGFSKEERTLHVQRVGYLASVLERHGIIVVASLISPYASSRKFVRDLCQDFKEIYISTPLEVCEKRDTKGLYAKARLGEIKQFTGIDDPYEPPAQPELEIDTQNSTIQECVDKIIELISIHH